MFIRIHAECEARDNEADRVTFVCRLSSPSVEGASATHPPAINLTLSDYVLIRSVE